MATRRAHQTTTEEVRITAIEGITRGEPSQTAKAARECSRAGADCQLEAFKSSQLLPKG